MFFMVFAVYLCVHNNSYDIYHVDWNHKQHKKTLLLYLFFYIQASCLEYFRNEWKRWKRGNAHFHKIYSFYSFVELKKNTKYSLQIDLWLR